MKFTVKFKKEKNEVVAFKKGSSCGLILLQEARKHIGEDIHEDELHEAIKAASFNYIEINLSENEAEASSLFKETNYIEVVVKQGLSLAVWKNIEKNVDGVWEWVWKPNHAFILLKWKEAGFPLKWEGIV